MATFRHSTELDSVTPESCFLFVLLLATDSQFRLVANFAQTHDPRPILRSVYGPITAWVIVVIRIV
jgi:hypothetical protein